MKHFIALILAGFLPFYTLSPAFAKNPQTLRASQLPDFSPLLSQRQNVIIGAIGDNYQRLKITFNTVKKIGVNTYQVTGFSQVKSNKIDFTGRLTLNKITLADSLHYGADDEYKNKGVTQEGTAIFDYVLNENPKAKYSGQFVGKAKVNWYQTKDHKLHYDDIESYSDSFYNRLYDGTWTDYVTGKTKRAVWADYTLTQAIAPNLNIGAGSFQPNAIYCNNGWDDYCKASE